MTAIVVEYRYLVLVLFVLISVVFLKAISYFRKKMSENYGPTLYESFGVKKINSQLFSYSNHPIKKVLSNDWNKWHKLIDGANLRTLYNRIFWLDNLWALFLILTLYAFGMYAVDTTNNMLGFAIVLVSAYLFDLLENFTYLRIWEGPYKSMPWISAIKLALYGTGFLWTLILIMTKFI